MQIIIVGSAPLSADLFARTSEVLGELGLADIIKIRESDDEAYKIELGITENPALCIEGRKYRLSRCNFPGNHSALKNGNQVAYYLYRLRRGI